MASPIDRWLVAIALVIALPSCRKGTDMAAQTPTGVAPTVALGPGLTPAPFAPGRYAVAVQRTLHGTHALQVLNEDSTAAFTLTLGGDGSASACRGWRYVMRNDGPEVHVEDRYREQQGYRGRYQVRDGVAEVELARDDAVCGHVFEGELQLARAPRLALRCVLATPTGGPIATPLLVCHPGDAMPAELDPYAVDALAPAGWFALGSGNGVRVWLHGRPAGAQAGEENKTTIRMADSPLGPDAWERPF